MNNAKQIKEYLETLNDFAIYNPVVLNGELIQDGNRRKLKNQHIRIDPIISNIEQDSTLLDLGCNTGYIIMQLMKRRNVKAIGIDKSDLVLRVCNAIRKIEKLDVSFLKYQLEDYIRECNESERVFDNVLFMSVYDFDTTISIMDKLLSVTKHKLFIEPTNHEGYSRKEINKKFKKQIDSKYDLKLLATTDYQNRFLMMVTKC